MSEFATPSVLVLDDHPVVADSVAALVRSIGHGVVIEQAHSLRAAQALHKRERQFDLLVIDLSLPDSRGIATFEALRSCWPLADLVVFSAIEHSVLHHQCMQGGALAFVTKSEDVDALSGVLREALQQRIGPATPAITAAGPRYQLTPKQHSIWQDVAAGYSNAEIGLRHEIALNTVKTHVREILERVGARNRTEAARLYFELH